MRRRPTDVVVLLAEVQAGGHIYEIGSRARVLRAEHDELTLALGGAEAAIGTCPPSHALAGPWRARLTEHLPAARHAR